MDNSTMNRFQRRKLQTRNQLKQAAITLILEKGYDAVTIDDIVARADLGKGTFYVHFKDKENLVWEVIQEGLEQVDREGNERYQNTPRFEYYGFLIAFEHAAQNRDLYRIMLGSKGHTILTNRVQQFVAVETEREIRRGVSLTELNLPPEFMAQFVTGALMQVLVWWLETPNSYSPADMAAMFYQMMYRQLPPSVE